MSDLSIRPARAVRLLNRYLPRQPAACSKPLQAHACWGTFSVVMTFAEKIGAFSQFRRWINARRTPVKGVDLPDGNRARAAKAGWLNWRFEQDRPARRIYLGLPLNGEARIFRRWHSAAIG